MAEYRAGVAGRWHSRERQTLAPIDQPLRFDPVFQPDVDDDWGNQGSINLLSIEVGQPPHAGFGLDRPEKRIRAPETDEKQRLWDDLYGSCRITQESANAFVAIRPRIGNETGSDYIDRLVSEFENQTL